MGLWLVLSIQNCLWQQRWYWVILYGCSYYAPKLGWDAQESINHQYNHRYLQCVQPVILHWCLQIILILDLQTCVRAKCGWLLHHGRHLGLKIHLCYLINCQWFVQPIFGLEVSTPVTCEKWSTLKIHGLIDEWIHLFICIVYPQVNG